MTIFKPNNNLLFSFITSLIIHVAIFLFVLFFAPVINVKNYISTKIIFVQPHKKTIKNNIDKPITSTKQNLISEKKASKNLDIVKNAPLPIQTTLTPTTIIPPTAISGDISTNNPVDTDKNINAETKTNANINANSITLQPLKIPEEIIGQGFFPREYHTKFVISAENDTKTYSIQITEFTPLQTSAPYIDKILLKKLKQAINDIWGNNLIATIKRDTALTNNNNNQNISFAANLSFIE